MRGYIEHDSRACTLGTHSNRGDVLLMCPVYLELRRARLRAAMAERRWRANHPRWVRYGA
jgi:hypothetical protein